MKNILIIIFLSISQILFAQDKKDKKEKTIEELTKSSSTIDGLFTIFQDSASGEIKMQIREDQLDKDYIYFSQIADGVTEAGSFRGAYGADVIFQIHKYYKIKRYPILVFYFIIQIRWRRI